MTKQTNYIHALNFQKLNGCYDFLVKITTNEKLFKRHLIELIHPKKHSTLLDIGSGTGSLAIDIKKRFPTIEVTGLDGDTDILKKARTKANKAGVDVDWQIGLAQALPFKNNSFDIITSTLFFHHLSSTDKRIAFSEIRRVLRPGGKLLIADWGKPNNFVGRLSFFVIRCLDGFRNTQDNLEGKLPKIMQTVGLKTKMEHSISAMLGQIEIITAG